MSHKELSDALNAVHRELLSSDHLDSADVEQLRATMDEIDLVLKQQNQNTGSLSDSVASSATRLESSHPRLKESLGRIADMLQQMGI